MPLGIGMLRDLEDAAWHGSALTLGLFAGGGMSVRRSSGTAEPALCPWQDARKAPPACAGGAAAAVLGEVMVSCSEGLSLLPPPAEICCGKLNGHVQKHHQLHSPAGFVVGTVLGLDHGCSLCAGLSMEDGAVSGDTAEPWARWVMHFVGPGSYSQPGEVQHVLTRAHRNLS